MNPHMTKYSDLDEQQRARICQLYRGGLNMALIGKRFGISNVLVRKVLLLAGVPVNRRGKNEGSA